MAPRKSAVDPTIPLRRSPRKRTPVKTYAEDPPRTPKTPTLSQPPKDVAKQPTNVAKVVKNPTKIAKKVAKKAARKVTPKKGKPAGEAEVAEDPLVYLPSPMSDLPPSLIPESWSLGGDAGPRTPDMPLLSPRTTEDQHPHGPDSQVSFRAYKQAGLAPLKRKDTDAATALASCTAQLRELQEHTYALGWAYIDAYLDYLDEKKRPFSSYPSPYAREAEVENVRNAADAIRKAYHLVTYGGVPAAAPSHSHSPSRSQTGKMAFPDGGEAVCFAPPGIQTLYAQIARAEWRLTTKYPIDLGAEPCAREMNWARQTYLRPWQHRNEDFHWVHQALESGVGEGYFEVLRRIPRPGCVPYEEREEGTEVERQRKWYMDMTRTLVEREKEIKERGYRLPLPLATHILSPTGPKLPFPPSRGSSRGSSRASYGGAAGLHPSTTHFAFPIHSIISSAEPEPGVLLVLVVWEHFSLAEATWELAGSRKIGTAHQAIGEFFEGNPAAPGRGVWAAMCEVWVELGERARWE